MAIERLSKNPRWLVGVALLVGGIVLGKMTEESNGIKVDTANCDNPPIVLQLPPNSRVEAENTQLKINGELELCMGGFMGIARGCVRVDEGSLGIGNWEIQVVRKPVVGEPADGNYTTFVFQKECPSPTPASTSTKTP